MDELEDFIKKNKGEFNSESPSPDVWNRIQEERSSASTPIPMHVPKQKFRPIFALRIAASVAIIALAMFGGYTLLTSDSEPTIATTEIEPQLPQEVQELDQYYNAQVVGQLAKVESIIENEEIFKEVKDELELLDIERTKLFNEYDQEVDDRQVVEALMNTYRMKLQILENIINLLDEKSNEENITI